MSLKEHVWVWKTIAKISAIGFLVTFGAAYLVGDLDGSQTENLKNFGSIFLAVLVGLFLLYMRFVKRTTSRIISDPRMVSQVVIKIGGALKGGTDMSLEELEKNAVDYLKQKYANLEDVVRDGEHAFKDKEGNDLDFLFEFMEIYDWSGKRVQTLTIKKGDAAQIEFVGAMPKSVERKWKVERINRG